MHLFTGEIWVPSPQFLLCQHPLEVQSARVKFILILSAALTLNSCNTLIGMGRDTKKGYQWTTSKFQGAGGGDSADGPTY
jgi:predicted small secreted protein